MIYEVRVASKEDRDPKGEDLTAEIKRTLRITSIKKIQTAKVYRLEGISKKEALEFTEKVLFEPIDQKMAFNKPIFKNADSLIEIAYKPGVMNPEAGSLLKSARDLGINLKAADSSWEYAFFGKISKDEAKNLITELRLYNPLIEQIVDQKPKTLLISAKSSKTKIIPIRNLNEKELLELSKDRLFLNLDEMKIIQNYFKSIKRDPTDCEIEVLAQTWSEHCVHKTFKAKLTVDGKKKEPLIERIKKTLKFNKKIIVSAFDDNSGVIDFYDDWAISGKVETHNWPSAIEPYGGAMTGSGGVFRDILGTGKGAKPIVSTDIFCFAPPNLQREEIPTGCLAPDYLLRKVVAGIRDYGNRVGIPTNNGSIHFHKDFKARPTVAAGSFGIIPKDKAKMGKAQSGDVIITIGGRTGRDGVHGATFSSGEMDSRTINIAGSAVQIGNAIEEKRIIDLVLKLREKNLIEAITDCGAGGYSSAIGEMGKGTGALVNLEKVPLKYSGLAPWEIFLSESQERMVLAVSPKNLAKVLKFSKLYNVKAAIIGKFGSSKRLKVTYGKKVVCDLDMQFLHHGLPQRKMIGKTKRQKIVEKSPNSLKDFVHTWEKVLAHGNVCSKEPIIRMYDHTVQGTSVLQPLGGVGLDGPNDGVVIKPLLNKPYGLVVTHGLNPILVRINPYWGSVWAITEAVSNFVAIGGDIKNAALIDNFIWPFPDDESLADLDKSVDACFKIAKILSMPFVSGKDSLSSTYRYPDGKVLKIPPVLLISVFGKIPDVSKTASSDFKSPNSTIVLVGKPDFKNLGGSAYFDVTKSSGQVPKVDLKNLNVVFRSINAGIQSGRILACHDISEGGLGTTLFEMCLGGGCGATIDLSSISQRNTPGVSFGATGHTPGVRSDFILFNETSGCFLVEVENEKVARKLFAKVPHYILGQTSADSNIRVNLGSKNLCNLSVSRLKESWQKPMREIFH